MDKVESGFTDEKRETRKNVLLEPTEQITSFNWVFNNLRIN